MFIIAAIIGGLVTVTLVLPFLQTGKMKDFTQPEPIELSTKEVLPAPPAALVSKFQAQKTQLESTTEPVVLTYSLAELNDMIRAYEECKELQGTFEVKSITPEVMLCDISFLLNTNPLSSDKDKRYLNGTIHAVPAIKNDELILKISKVESVIGEVPEGFRNHLQEYRIMQPYTNHESIGRVMFGCESIVLGEGEMSLTVNPQKFADPKSVEPVKDNSAKKQQRRFLMPLMSFIMIGGLFFFMLRRRNAKEAKKWQDQANRE